MALIQMYGSDGIQNHRQVFFNLGGITNASGLQPLLSINGGTYSTSGISPLMPEVSGVPGTYFATINQNAIHMPGDYLQTFVAISGINYTGDSVEVIRPYYQNMAHNACQIAEFNPYAGSGQRLTRVHVLTPKLTPIS